MTMRTWKVIEWENEPLEKGESWPLDCECGIEAACPAGRLKGAMVIAITGTSFIFEPPGFVPPESWLPTKIQCRRCKRMLISKKKERVADVR